MRGVLAIVRVSLRQALGGKRTIALGLVASIPAIVMALASQHLTERAAFERFHEAPMGILFLMVLPICALVIGSGAMGDERRDGTLSFLVLRPIPRWVIVAAKFFSAWLAATLIVAVSGLAASIALGARSGNYETAAPVVIAVAISTAAYVAVFMLLGHLTSRAVLIGLVYVFIWESSITFAAPALANVSLFRIGLTAYASMVSVPREFGDVMGHLAPGTWGALAKIAGISVVAVWALASMLRHRDIVGE